MGRQSIVDAWLGKFPKERQKEIEQKIRSAPTIRIAYQELKSLKFRGSYDAVQSWRAKDARGRSEGLSDQASKVTAIAARMPLESDPIASAIEASAGIEFAVCKPHRATSAPRVDGAGGDSIEQQGSR